jgi:hypothetical protein
VEVQRVADAGLLHVVEAKLPTHVVDQDTLRREYQVLTQVLEGHSLVMQLNQSCLRGHLPVHAESLDRAYRLGLLGVHLAQELLSRGPDRPRRIESLEFHPHKVLDLAASSRYEEVIDAPAGDFHLLHHVEFVSGLMQCQQVQNVSENLLALQESMRADDDGLWLASVHDSAGSDGNGRLALAYLHAPAVEEWTLMAGYESTPVVTGLLR